MVHPATAINYFSYDLCKVINNKHTITRTCQFHLPTLRLVCICVPVTAFTQVVLSIVLYYSCHLVVPNLRLQTWRCHLRVRQMPKFWRLKRKLCLPNSSARKMEQCSLICQEVPRPRRQAHHQWGTRKLVRALPSWQAWNVLIYDRSWPSSES